MLLSGVSFQTPVALSSGSHPSLLNKLTSHLVLACVWQETVSTVSWRQSHSSRGFQKLFPRQSTHIIIPWPAGSFGCSFGSNTSSGICVHVSRENACSGSWLDSIRIVFKVYTKGKDCSSNKYPVTDITHTIVGRWPFFSQGQDALRSFLKTKLRNHWWPLGARMWSRSWLGTQVFKTMELNQFSLSCHLYGHLPTPALPMVLLCFQMLNFKLLKRVSNISIKSKKPFTDSWLEKKVMQAKVVGNL